MNIKKLKTTVLRYLADINYYKFIDILVNLGIINRPQYSSESVAFDWICNETNPQNIDKVLTKFGY